MNTADLCGDKIRISNQHFNLAGCKKNYLRPFFLFPFIFAESATVRFLLSS